MYSQFTGGRDKLKNRYSYIAQDLPDNHPAVLLRGEGYVSGAFIVECFYTDFDGIQYGPVRKTFLIRKYEGARDITTLPVYPLAFDHESVKARQTLVTRGNRFADFCGSAGVKHNQYTGLTLDDKMEHVII